MWLSWRAARLPACRDMSLRPHHPPDGGCLPFLSASLNHCTCFHA